MWKETVCRNCVYGENLVAEVHTRGCRGDPPQFGLTVSRGCRSRRGRTSSLLVTSYYLIAVFRGSLTWSCERGRSADTRIDIRRRPVSPVGVTNRVTGPAPSQRTESPFNIWFPLFMPSVIMLKPLEILHVVTNGVEA